jgi:hypothetical protein
MFVDVGLHLLVRPRCDRVDLHEAEGVVERDQRSVGACRGLDSPDAGDPRAVVRQFLLQRRHFAHRAAAVRFAGEQVLAVDRILFCDGLLGAGVDDVHAVDGLDGIARSDGLGKVVAGVEEQDVHSGVNLCGEVNENPVLHVGGDDEIATEGVLGPLQQLERACAVEFAGTALGDVLQLVDRQIQSGTHRKSASSARTAH